MTNDRSKSSLGKFFRKLGSTFSRTSQSSKPSDSPPSAQNPDSRALISSLPPSHRQTLAGGLTQTSSSFGINEDRPLRTSQAALNLHSEDSEVQYASGRRSIVQKTSALNENIRRASLALNANEIDQLRALQQQDEAEDEDEDAIGYNFSFAQEYANDQVEDLDDEAMDNFDANAPAGRRSTRMSRAGSLANSRCSRSNGRSSSILSNKAARRSSFALSDSAYARSSTFSNVGSRSSAFSNGKMANQRNRDPESRQRPASAGLPEDGCGRVDGGYGSDGGERCLSDTELDTMEIVTFQAPIMA